MQGVTYLHCGGEIWTTHHQEVSALSVASNPGFPFRILSRSFGEKSEDFSPKLQDKIRNRKPGFEAMLA